MTLDDARCDGSVDLTEIESIGHKALRRFFGTGDPKHLVDDVARLRKMLAFIDAAERMDELSVPPNFGLHGLVGHRKGAGSMTAARNWHLTFSVNEDGALIDMDLKDYHGA